MQDNFLSKFVLKQPNTVVFLLLTFLSLSAYAQKIKSFSNPLIGDGSRIKLNSSDVIVRKKGFKKVNGDIHAVDQTIQWIRTDDVLLKPRVILSFKFKGKSQDFYLTYNEQTILFQKETSAKTGTKIYYSLYDDDPIKVYFKNQLIGEVTTELINKGKNFETHLIDYSCHKYDLDITGLDGEYASFGCRIKPFGALGKERPLMELLWNSANYKVIKNSRNTTHSIFLDSRPSSITVRDKNGKKKVVKIKARIPSRLHRLSTAIGFGPYEFDTKYQEDLDSNSKSNKEVPSAPAAMLYFNYKINDTNSVRGFNATIAQESKFNNAGIYYATDIATLFDTRFKLTTLIGMQYLYFNFDEDSPEISEPLFPQGIEFLYQHAFDIPNFVIGGGAFLSTTPGVDYENAWLRAGKGVYWELNYIRWGQDKFNARMWGLSLIIPFKQFL